jgi:hypothetical protein
MRIGWHPRSRPNGYSTYAHIPLTAPSRESAATHARTILAHLDRAKASNSGRDITNLIDDDLIADLRQHRMLG